jgi:hypothetical protein
MLPSTDRSATRFCGGSLPENPSWEDAAIGPLRRAKVLRDEFCWSTMQERRETASGRAAFRERCDAESGYFLAAGRAAGTTQTLTSDFTSAWNCSLTVYMPSSLSGPSSRM